MLRVVVVCGTRPEAIKLAPVVKAFRNAPAWKVSFCVTGQHRELLQPMLDFFDLQPDIHFQWPTSPSSLVELTHRLSSSLAQHFQEFQPDLVLVQGDTASSFSAALTAFQLQIPVVHLEAGLRTGSLDAPFPEEGYRQVISRLSRLHLAVTERNKKQLLSEGIAEDSIQVIGNTVIDSLKMTLQRKAVVAFPPALEALLSGQRRIVTVTCHRREVWGSGIEGVGRALLRVAKCCPKVEFVFPMHPNPVLRQPLLALLQKPGSSSPVVSNLTLCEPLPYPAFVSLLQASSLILTDSGGVQEEAAELKVPVLVLREATDRPEAVEAGLAAVVGLKEELVVTETERLLKDEEALLAMRRGENPFGDGRAAERVLEFCEEFLLRGATR